MQFAGQDLVAVCGSIHPEALRRGALVAIAPRIAVPAAPMVAAQVVVTPAAAAAAVARVVVIVATRVAAVVVA